MQVELYFLPLKSSTQKKHQMQAQVLQYGYLVENVIGKGSFARVYSATSTSTNQKVAIKCISKKKMQQMLAQAQQKTSSSLETEIQIMKQVKHENCLQLISYHENEEFHFLVMDLMAGDLHGSRLSGFTEYQLQRIAYQIGT